MRFRYKILVQDSPSFLLVCLIVIILSAVTLSNVRYRKVEKGWAECKEDRDTLIRLIQGNL